MPQRVTLKAADLPALLARHRRELLRRGRSPHTVEIYGWAVQTLIRYIGNADGQVVNRDLLEDWQDSLMERFSEKSRSMAVTGVRALIKWAADRDEPLCDARLERAIVGVKVHKKQPRPLHPNDLIRITAHLIERCDPVLAAKMGERRPTLRDLRDRALFHYIMGTGGRVSEILQVHRASFEKETIRQKGGGPKEFVCQPGVAGLINHYLAARTDDLPWLWIALPPGKPVCRLDPSGVLKIWERLAGAYLVPRFTTHQLRHTSATTLAERGTDPLTIAYFLGHGDMRSVHVYTKVSANRLQFARATLDVAI